MEQTHFPIWSSQLCTLLSEAWGVVCLQPQAGRQLWASSLGLPVPFISPCVFHESKERREGGLNGTEGRGGTGGGKEYD